MKSKLFVFILFLLLSPVCFPGAPLADELKSVADFEGGKLYRAGDVRVLEMNGSYRRMGRQYGFLLKDDLLAMIKGINEIFLNNQDEKKRMPLNELNTIARAVFDRYPRRYKEILYGMEETSGLGLEKVLLINAVEWFPKINKLTYGRCSGIAVWGPYTSGQAIFGRNNDDHPVYFNFARMVVAVFKPNDGSIPTALIGYPGVIYNATGINAEGLFMELNSANEMGFSLNRISIFTTLFSYLQDYRNAAELDRAMRSTLANMSVLVTVADPTRGYSYEYSLWDVKRWDQDAEGVVAVANAYSHPDWGITPPQPARELGDNQIRKGNLLDLAARYKGSITPEVMMKKIMDKKQKEGGATIDGTIYQVVAALEDRTVWIKVPGRVEWTKIPLKAIFGRQQAQSTR